VYLDPRAHGGVISSILAATYQEWDAFLSAPLAPNKPLQASWLRALQSGLAPENAPGIIVSDLVERRQRFASWQISPMLWESCSELVDHGFAVLISDAEGVLLDVSGNASMSAAMMDAGVVPGTCWREADRGTNAIGEVLRTGQAVQVIGAAHFQRSAHVLACYAAPIIGPGGELIGVIDASTWVQRAHPLAGVAVAATARTVGHWHPKASTSPPIGGFSAIAGGDAVARATVQRAAAVAPSRIPVLLSGETGTGKELLARAIHAASRRAGPFVTMNASTLHDGLVQAELFGTDDGAFTGSREGGRAGLLETAHGGTLLIDEVAELSPRTQAMLLRFLDDGSFRRVGSARPLKVDVRLIAATWEDLSALVREGRFRKDLFYRLRGAVLTLPPLRARSDREVLAGELLRQLAPRARLLPAERDWVRRHPWPGNIRELKAALALRQVLGPGSLPTATGDATDIPVNGTLIQAEHQATLEALRACNGNRSAAARQLGIARSTLYRIIERHGL